MMAHYTITIKTLIDNDFDFQMTTYPIFDESYRNVLNQKILNHYYESEIGFETAALFRFYLNTKLNEIMPYYNDLYKMQKKMIDENLLLNNVNLEERLTGSNTNNTTDNTTNNTTNNTTTSGQSSSTSSSSGTNNSKNVFQDTPQGSVLNQTLDDASLYATNVTLDRNTSSNSITDSSSNSGTANNTIANTIAKTGTLNGTNSYIKTIVGNNGGRFNIDLLKDIEEKLMNIDLLVINQLNDLFMGIF